MQNHNNMKRIVSAICLSAILLSSCGESADNTQKDAQSFIDKYTEQYVKLYAQSSEAQWKFNTEIIDGDSTNKLAAQHADEEMAPFTGNKENIEQGRKYLESKDKLTDIQVKQLEGILYRAANNPETVADVVKTRIKAENDQVEKLYGYQYMLGGNKVSTNDIDEALKTETNLDKRLAAWNASKEVGTTLKDGLTNLRDLRNKTVQALGYNDYFTYQVSEYEMETPEMMQTMERLMDELYPLYRELHTWMRYDLAKKYGAEVPDYLPAHWLSNRWGQDWSASVEVEGLDINAVLKEKSGELIVKEGEKLYTNIGFP